MNNGGRSKENECIQRGNKLLIRNIFGILQKAFGAHCENNLLAEQRAIRNRTYIFWINYIPSLPRIQIWNILHPMVLAPHSFLAHLSPSPSRPLLSSSLFDSSFRLAAWPRVHKYLNVFIWVYICLFKSSASAVTHYLHHLKPFDGLGIGRWLSVCTAASVDWFTYIINVFIL